jgi:hypothetical protein
MHNNCLKDSYASSAQYNHYGDGKENHNEANILE